MTNLGTVQNKYGKYWIYQNPNTLTGPSAWNVANLGFDDGESQVFAVPPIVATQDENEVSLSYSISACKALSELNKQLYVDDAPTIFQDTLTDITQIEGEYPINTNTFRRDTIIFFDIKDLPSADIATVDSEETSGYNGNNIVSLTTSLPLEATEADGVATVTFDISTLEDA